MAPNRVRPPRRALRATAWATTLAVAAGIAITAPLDADAAESGNAASVLQAWGGDNTHGENDLPFDLRSGRKMVTRMDLGASHGVAITSDKKLYAWGDNAHGEGVIPQHLQNLGAIDVAAGVGFNAVVGDDYNIRVWGDTSYGQENVPKAAVDADILQVAAGTRHVIAKSSAGKVYAWGENNFGQTSIPAAVNNTTIQSVDASVYYSMALSSSGKVYVWGSNTWGVVDVPSSLADKKVVQIAAGYRHALALTSDNEIVAWGDNKEGALNVPALAPGDRWTQIAAGNGFSAGVAKDSPTAGVWGSGGTSVRQPPHPPVAGSAPVAIAAGGSSLVQGYRRLGVVAAPKVTTVDGVFRVGTPIQAVHATFGPDDGAVTKTGRWLKVTGEVVTTVGTGMSYTPTTADIGSDLVFRTSGVSESYGSAFSETSPIPTRGVLFASATKPVIAGDAYVGSTLKGSLSSVPVADSYRYDWYADGVYRRTSDARGEYVIQEADRGKKITLMGYADKAGYERIAAGTSDPTPTVVDAPQFEVSSPPLVTGAPRVGTMLGVTAAVVSPAPAQTTYQWYRNGQPISGATGSTYRAAQIDYGRSVGVMVKLVGSGRRDTEVGSQTLTIGKVSPRLSWTAKQGGRSGSKRNVRISVAASATGVPALSGIIKIRDGSTIVRMMTLKRGKASSVVKLKRGKRTIKVTYYGATGVHGTSLTKKLRVR